MKTTINIVCILGIIAVLAFEYMPDVVIPINGGGSEITAAFEDSLSGYLTEIAESDKTIAEKEALIMVAFEDSSKRAYMGGLADRMDALPTDATTTDDVDKLLLQVAEELK